MAVLWGNIEVVILLISEGADINVESEYSLHGGGTPLNIAIQRGHEDIAELLRQHGGHE